MNWAAPGYFWALWTLPVFFGLLWYLHRWKRAAQLRFLDARMSQQLAPKSSNLRLITKAVLQLAAMTALIIALARPQRGFYVEEVTAQGADLIILVDVSRSMLAEDVVPNRMERAKSDIIDLLQRLPGDRVGLIAFAGAPSVMVPLTLDHGFLRLVLQDLGPDSAPRGGTNIGDAVRKAIEQFDAATQRDRALVVFTDGGDQDSLPIEAAKLAAERRIRIIAIGLGDPTEGARIPKRNKEGQLSFQQYDGKEVWTKMDDSVLRQMATITSGAYVPAQTRSYDLGEIYSQNLKELGKGELFTDKRKRPYEQFQWPVAIGIGLIVVERLISGYSLDGQQKGL